jgi:micrococcal nuclease
MYEYLAEIRSVYDGDTVRLDIDLGMDIWVRNVSVRINGIDTPELKTTEGKAARDYAKSLLKVRQKVTVKTIRDKKEKWGRYLADIILPDGSSFSTNMVAAGHAKTYFGGKRI